MERKVVEEECKSKEALAENTVLRSRNDQLVLEKEVSLNSVFHYID